MQYKIEYTMHEFYRLYVEADSAEEAREKFLAGEYDYDAANNFGGEIEDSVTVEEAS